MELVLPVSISCLCRKTFALALPLPLSKTPFVKTPNKVDFPESTFPTVVMRNSKCFASLGKTCLTSMHFACAFFLPVFLSKASDTFAPNCFAMFSNVSMESFISSSLIPRTVPSSSTPISYKHSPLPSFNRHRSCVVSLSKVRCDGFTRWRLYSTLPSSHSGSNSKSKGVVGDAFASSRNVNALSSFSSSIFFFVVVVLSSVSLSLDHLLSLSLSLSLSRARKSFLY